MNIKRYLWAFLALFIALPGTQQAQTPEKDPFDIPVLTLSKGKYKEFHDQDTVVKIGHVLFNVHTGHIVGFIEQDTLHGDDAFQADIATRWLSPDPLAEEFPSWSPFTFVEDNPIVLVDPDGRAARLAIGGGPDNTATWLPLTKKHLRTIAISQGVDVRAFRTGDSFNRLIGLGFENSITKFSGKQHNNKKFSTSVRRRHQNVVPDFVMDKATFSTRFDFSTFEFNVERKTTRNGQMVQILDTDLTNFAEVKSSPRISLSSSDYQLAGMVEAIGSQQVFGENGGLLGNVSEIGGGVLYFITTSDTKIGQSLLDYASEQGVTIFQSELYVDPKDPDRLDFKITRPSQLNADFDKGFSRHRKEKERVQGKPVKKFLSGTGKLEF